MGYAESFNEVVVWIDDDLGSAGTERLKAEIDDLPNIASKQYISKEDALKEAGRATPWAARAFWKAFSSTRMKTRCRLPSA